MLLKLNVWQIFCPKVHTSWSLFVFSPSVMFYGHFEAKKPKHKGSEISYNLYTIECLTFYHIV